MSGKKSIIKTMLTTILLSLFFLAIGGILLFEAIAGRSTNYEPPAGFVKTMGEIESIDKKTVQQTSRNKKITKVIYSATINVQYEGGEYFGVFGVMPFSKTGSEIEVFLDPSTGEVKPATDTVLAAMDVISFIPGIFVSFAGVIIVLVAIVSAIAKLSVFKEKNKVYGVIVDVIENVNITVDHKHPKKAVCEVVSPVTGEIIRFESANSTLDVFGMIGMNVPVYFNRIKPSKSFADLENASGNNQMSAGQPRVHDFRNL